MVSSFSPVRPVSLPPSLPINQLSGSVSATPVSEPLFQQPNSNRGKAFDFNIVPASPIRLGQTSLLNLQIFRPSNGARPSQFDIVHEKPARIILVSQDLTDFQHVHPQVVGPGFLQIPVVLNKPGPYKLFLQFTTPEEKGEQTLNKPFELGRAIQPSKPLLPDAQFPKQVGEYTYRITGLPTRQQSMAMPKVEILKNGVPVKNIEPYLGAGAHGVIIGQNAQSFLHVHPMSQPKDGLYSSPIKFHTEIKQPGLYKMWVQTQLEGKVRTVDWTFQV